MSHRRALVLGALAASLCLPSTAFGLDEVNSKKLRDAVTVNGILQHERALQADRERQRRHPRVGHAGLRSLVAVRQAAPGQGGLQASRSRNSRSRSSASSRPPTLSQVSPTAKDYETDDVRVLGQRRRHRQAPGRRGQHGAAARRARLDARRLRPPPTSPASRAGNIALIQRGTCNFGVKADNAEGRRRRGRDHLQRGPGGPHRPDQRHARRAQATSRSSGSPTPTARRWSQQLKAGARSRCTSTTVHRGRPRRQDQEPDRRHQDRRRRTRPSWSARTWTPSSRVRASTTTAPAPPAILEIAEAMAEQKIKPRRTVRFAFWGAEESGLLGSEHYVATLPDERAHQDLREPELRHGRLAQLRALRLRRRRLGHAGAPALPAPAQIEGVFTNYFASPGPGHRSRPSSTAAPTTARSSRSASPPAACSPAPRASRPPSRRPSTAAPPASPYDPCYHQACDTINNLNANALNEMGDAAAHATLTLAKSKTGLVPGRLPQGRPRQVQGQEVRRQGRSLARAAPLDPLAAQPGHERVEPVLQHEQLEVPAGAIELRARRERPRARSRAPPRRGSSRRPRRSACAQLDRDASCRGRRGVLEPAVDRLPARSGSGRRASALRSSSSRAWPRGR